MSFFHPASHPLNPFAAEPGDQDRPGAQQQQRGYSYPEHSISASSSFSYSAREPSIDSDRDSAVPAESASLRMKTTRGAFDPEPAAVVLSSPPRKKIFIRTEEEQFVLPFSKVNTNEGLVMLLSRLYSPDLLHRIQIRYDTTTLGQDGNPVGPLSGGAVIYPEYWESLVEDNMRIVVFLLPDDNELHNDLSRLSVSARSSSRAVSTSSTTAPATPVHDSVLLPRSPSSTLSSPNEGKSAGAKSGARQDIVSLFEGAEGADKENNSTTPDRPRTYSSAVQQPALTPLGVSTNSSVANKRASIQPALPAVAPAQTLTATPAVHPSLRYQQQVIVMPEDNLSVRDQNLYKPGSMSALTPDEVALKAATEPFSLTYQGCITLLARMLPEKRHLTHPRLSPNIVTIRPCHENTLWVFCVVQHTLHPVSVRAFETIDIEELILRVLPPEVSIDSVVVLWRNMKFGGEGLPSYTYNAKKETRGTGGRNMWKKNLAVLAAKNAEVFVVVYQGSDCNWGRAPQQRRKLEICEAQEVEVDTLDSTTSKQVQKSGSGSAAAKSQTPNRRAEQMSSTRVG
ncbi:hypothetical protein BZA70DRAFT_283866 [Myxozyma melibiosi]|uniref:Sin1 middle CRIM domain-containing protein n=1 Tax=Myxozyma melibiosi TaxID=54550 RepID=A0ABR1EZR9_9ASCO